MKKIPLISNSCEERQLDLNLIKEFLIKNNFSITFNIKEADLIIFSTCAFSKDPENYPIRMIFEYSEMKGMKSCELANKVPGYVKRHRRIRIVLKHLPQKIQFILDIKHPYAWIKYGFIDKF